MEANRTKIKLVLIQNLSQPDYKYPLLRAYTDLETYKASGSIPGAISSITQSAANEKQDAQNKILLSGITLETPAVAARYDVLTGYIQSLVAAKDTDTLMKMAQALKISVPPGSTYIQIKQLIVEYLYVYIDSKPTEAEKLTALDQIAKLLKPYVTF